MLRELFFFKSQRLGLTVGLVLAPLQISFVDRQFVNVFFATRRGVVALDKGALLANLDLDRARLARSVGLLDLGGRLLGQRDLLALGASNGAVRGAQKVEQPLLVAFAQCVVGGRLGHTGGLQLFEQGRGRAVELGGKLGDGGHGHW